MSFCEPIESVDNVARFCKILSKDPNIIGGIKRYYDTWTNSGFEHLELLSVTPPSMVDIGGSEQSLTSSPYHTTEDGILLILRAFMGDQSLSNL